MAGQKIGIIGGGILGASIAYHLSSHKEIEVTVFEKNTIGSGTTAKSAGTVCLIDDSVPGMYFPERVYGFNKFLEMEKDEKGCTGFDNCGTLAVGTDDASVAYAKNAVNQTNEAGYKAIWTEDEAEIKKIVPDLVLDKVVGAAYTADDGWFDATAISNKYIKMARANGANVQIGAEVTGVTMSGGKATAIESSKGNFEFDIVINAGGPWARFLGRMPGMELPLWHTKAEAFILESKPPLGYKLPILKYPKFYTRPEGHHTFICKSHVGLNLDNPNDSGVWDPDKLTMTGGTDPYFWDHISEQLLDFFPKLLETVVANSWVGYRCYTQDGMPLIGESRVPGYMIATGGSGNGVIEAPAIGKAFEEFIVNGKKIAFGDKEPLFDLLKVDRFPEVEKP